MAADKCRARFSYSVADHTLPVVELVTDLGVTYDNKLKFGPYIDKVCSKASSRAKLILKCFQIVYYWEPIGRELHSHN